MLTLTKSNSASCLESLDELSMSWKSLEEYVKHHGGDKPISRILIANNGIAAVKGIRSMRKWEYSELGIEKALCFVCMVTPDDLAANAEYVRLADEVVEVPGGSNNNNYANVDLIVDIAQRKQVDAVWAGWGHASENPSLPARLAADKRKITFLGPGAVAMYALGDKIGSSIIAQSAGVPCINWSGTGISMKEQLDTGNPDVPPELYKQACVTTVEEALEKGDMVGYPLMVKASEGGGGKGIRRVEKREDLATALLQVQTEVVGSPVFLMQLFSGGRHLEVQVLADQHGHVTTLNGRDCSIQRRHQKIIEEGPPVIADSDTLEKMERAAASLARAVGYVGVGTVEYLYRDGQFYFLEMNPRLQVEHTVTELVTDVNLPLAMLLVGMGIPLSQIPDIRSLFQLEDRHGDSPIDFLTAKRGPPKCHVIAARITAENPDAGFRPTSGQIFELNFRVSPHVWGYFSVFGRGAVHEFADSQFGHIFSRGGSRESARKHLILALKELTLYGQIRTTTQYLIKMLELEDYKTNAINTQWLDGLLANKTINTSVPEGDSLLLNVVCGAVVKAMVAVKQLRTETVTALDYGRMPSSSLLCTEFKVELILDNMKYCITVTCTDKSQFALALNGSLVNADARTLSDGRLLVFVNGKTVTVFFEEDSTGLRLEIDGKTVVFEKENDPATMRASTTGKLMRFLVKDGEHVQPGTPFAEIEVMKMLMQLQANHAGVITHVASEEMYVKAGDVLATLDLDDKEGITRAEVFTGQFPPFLPPHLRGVRCHQQLQGALRRAEAVLGGFTDPAFQPKNLGSDIVNEIASALYNPLLPYFEIQESFNAVRAALPKEVAEEVEKVISQDVLPQTGAGDEEASALRLRRRSSTEADGDGEEALQAAEQVKACCTKLLETMSPYEGDSRLAQLFATLRKHAEGHTNLVINTFGRLMEQYIAVEEKFSGKLDRREEVIAEMVKEKTIEAKSELGLNARRQRQLACVRVYEEMVSNHGVHAKSNLMLHCLAALQNVPTTSASAFSFDRRHSNKDPTIGAQAALSYLMKLLRELEQFRGQPYSEVALEARRLRIKIWTPSIETRRNALYSLVQEAAKSWQDASPEESWVVVKGYRNYGNALSHIVGSVHSIFEEMSSFLGPVYPTEVRFAVMELFVRRSHRQYAVEALSICDESTEHDREVMCAEFWFQRKAQDYALDRAASNSDHAFPTASSDEDIARNNRRLSGPGAALTGAAELDGGGKIPSKLRKNRKAKVTGGSFGGSFMDSISDMQELVKDWDGATHESVYPSRYNLIIACHNTATLEDRLTDLLKTRFCPEQCGQEGSTLVSPMARPGSREANMGGAPTIANNSQKAGAADGSPVHVLNLMLVATKGSREAKLPDVAFLEICSRLIQERRALLRELKISRVTVLVLRSVGYPAFYTFRDRLEWNEDLIYRNLNPPRAFMIEIGRLSQFYDIQPVADGPILNRHFRTFIAKQKGVDKKARGGDRTRFFVRALVLGRVMADREESKYFLESDVEHMLLECCDSLALSKGYVEKTSGKDVAFNRFGTLQMCNHLFLSVLPHIYLTRAEAIDILHSMVERNFGRLRQVGVIEVEIPLTVLEPLDEVPDTPTDRDSADITNASMDSFSGPGTRTRPVRMRVVCSNPSGHNVQTDAYLEVATSAVELKGGSHFTFKSILTEANAFRKGPLDGKELSTPYPPIDSLELRRLTAKGKETTFVYDFVTLFEKAVSKEWEEYKEQQDSSSEGLGSWIATNFWSSSGSKKPNKLLEAQELELNDKGDGLVAVDRAEGSNKCGMVAWRMRMHTPEQVGGREIIVIANDVTFQNGSFGIMEDQLFNLATELAMKEGIPRIFVAANSGARIGLVEEVKKKFRVQWKDPLNPLSGMQFLYVDDTDLDLFRKHGMCVTEPVTLPDGTKREKLTAVIGPDGIGVENLRGSGMIAGTTCRAYEETFTLTFVSGTSVGIGAYLVRLGQRAIQKGPPILLTGEAALNKVLGKQVYTSNYQLGGTHIMHKNGVSHKVVDNDFEGVRAILKWLSFVPAVRNGPLPIQPNLTDKIDRKVFDPRRGPQPSKVYDPRILLTGAMDAIGKWRGGMFDKGSFVESLDGWGMTTICGRARLGGIPVGVVMPEMRTVSKTHPADPADQDSMETTVSQAGQVWFPDSAYKTATAIKDMNQEGLPLFIIANWRGFSGGQRDMYEEILKFGSMIVEGLVAYKQPVFVYIPPEGELRGGAWVVIDPTINAEVMEMYVDSTARGGILEPSGIVEIKYRRDQQLEKMAYLDVEVAALERQLSAAANAGEADRSTIAEQLRTRQELLLPTYQKVAEHYADLHDVPARMQAKGCIHGTIDWKWTRKFFYGRLRRRLAEQALLRRMKAADEAGEVGKHKAMVRECIKTHVEDKRPRLNSLGEEPPDAASSASDDDKMAATIKRDHRIADLLEGSSESDAQKVHALVAELHRAHIRHAVAHLVTQDEEAALEGFTTAVQGLSLGKRQEMLNTLLARMSSSWALEGKSTSAPPVP